MVTYSTKDKMTTIEFLPYKKSIGYDYSYVQFMNEFTIHSLLLVCSDYSGKVRVSGKGCGMNGTMYFHFRNGKLDNLSSVYPAIRYLAHSENYQRDTWIESGKIKRFQMKKISSVYNKHVTFHFQRPNYEYPDVDTNDLSFYGIMTNHYIERITFIFDYMRYTKIFGRWYDATPLYRLAHHDNKRFEDLDEIELFEYELIDKGIIVGDNTLDRWRRL